MWNLVLEIAELVFGAGYLRMAAQQNWRLGITCLQEMRAAALIIFFYVEKICILLFKAFQFILFDSILL